MAHEDVFEFTDENFKEAVLASDIPVVVDFWAEWCGPCKILTPIIDELAGEFQGKVKIGKLNIDNNPQTASHYGITSIPTLLFVKNNAIQDQHVGVLTQGALKQKIDSFIA